MLLTLILLTSSRAYIGKFLSYCAYKAVFYDDNQPMFNVFFAAKKGRGCQIKTACNREERDVM